MADVLVYCPDPSTSSLIQTTAEKFEINVKICTSFQNCVNWLKNQNFDGLIVTSDETAKNKNELAEQLWNLNPFANFIVFDAQEKIPPATSLNPVGTDAVIGAHAWNKLEELLKTISAKKNADKSAFKIMVVEDLESANDIICAFIQALGFAYVRGYTSPKQALSDLERSPDSFDCIICDIQMPEMNGKDIIRLVRNHSALKHLPIIALTAYGTADCLVECLQIGASGFLAKPPRKAELARELSRAQLIAARLLSPRLANIDEANSLKQLLIERGFTDDKI